LINQLLLICSTISIYEFIKFVKLKDIIQSNLKIYKKIIKLFYFKKVSDFRKEKLIFNYSKSLFIISMKIFSILIGILAIMLILNLLSNSFLNLIISVLGVVEITLVFIVYHQLRKRIDAKL
jgi:fatty acid desaturase